MAVSLSTSSSATSHNELVLRPNPDTLRRPYSICWPYHTANAPSGQLTILYWSNQKYPPIRHGQRRLKVYSNTGIAQQDRTVVFGPKDVLPVAVHSFSGTQDAEMYTRSELSSFWDSILMNDVSRNALKKFSQKFIVFSYNERDPDSFLYYAPRTDFFADNMISPGYFKAQFTDTFGPVAYVLEHCGIYFPVFVFFKLILYVVIMVISQLEKN